ncbi:unnamed protein product [Fraxinus pennsylvanica]|uniref:Uncharacterized protein n=1 Tax=Fraxinus pennsylvanica TaxID=56036 RepID=A0AAD2DW31_9LAMI|nr:unnamed protein product [Fraxinus pennsylvanica]
MSPPQPPTLYCRRSSPPHCAIYVLWPSDPDLSIVDPRIDDEDVDIVSPIVLPKNNILALPVSVLIFWSQMETDGAGGSGSGADGCVGVESAGSLEQEKKTTPEGEQRVKRKMKTPYQLELLEKTYAS